MSEYRVKSVITEYPTGAEALFEISEGFFVPLDVFMEMKKKSGEELKKAIEQAKALEKKGKIKRFLKMAATKVKEKQAKKKAEAAKPKSEPRAVLGERKIVLPPASLKDEDLVDEATMLSYGFSKGVANPGNPDEVIRFYHHIDTDDYYYRDSDDNAVGYIGKRPEFLALSIQRMKEAKAKKLARGEESRATNTAAQKKAALKKDVEEAAKEAQKVWEENKDKKNTRGERLTSAAKAIGKAEEKLRNSRISSGGGKVVSLTDKEFDTIVKKFYPKK
jgi:hypothetical protein